MVKQTLALYGRAARTAFEALVRGPVALVGLVLAQIVLFAVSVLVGKLNLGLAGGFIVGFVSIGAAGAYLFLVEAALDSRRGLSWSLLQEAPGRLFWDVMNVAFIFFIAEFVLGSLLPGGVMLLLWAAVFVLFNPVPELIYCHRRYGGLDTLGAAFRWVKQNGPEWFIPHVLIGVGVFVLAPGYALPFLLAFGPRFGFVDGLAAISPLLLAIQTGLSPSTVALAVGIPVVTHAMMLFRGALFKELDGGGRRQRAWQARFK